MRTIALFSYGKREALGTCWELQPLQVAIPWLRWEVDYFPIVQLRARMGQKRSPRSSPPESGSRIPGQEKSADTRLSPVVGFGSVCGPRGPVGTSTRRIGARARVCVPAVAQQPAGGRRAAMEKPGGTLSAAVREHLRRLCLREFPCGTGSWVRAPAGASGRGTRGVWGTDGTDQGRWGGP